MLTYPQLTDAEQADLPSLLAEPVSIPSQFADSTHLVWHCQTEDGEMVLKVCNPATIHRSDFWLGLNHLFGADFPNSLGDMQCTHDFLHQHGSLKVPALVASKAGRFVLTRFLAGTDLDSSSIHESAVVALAKHIARLHQQTYSHWGNLYTPTFTAQTWAPQLQQTLRLLAEKSATQIDQNWLNDVLAQAGNIQESSFVPMMFDLRWDQLRDCKDHGIALIDLDAFVIAPKSLDLVLIKNLLTPTQFTLFKQHYETLQPWPEFGQHACYQLLLFLMQVFGETDLARWMQRI
jgi:Phosphotransferase enzyme family